MNLEELKIAFREHVKYYNNDMIKERTFFQHAMFETIGGKPNAEGKVGFLCMLMGVSIEDIIQEGQIELLIKTNNPDGIIYYFPTHDPTDPDPKNNKIIWYFLFSKEETETISAWKVFDVHLRKIKRKWQTEIIERTETLENIYTNFKVSYRVNPFRCHQCGFEKCVYFKEILKDATMDKEELYSESVRDITKRKSN